MKSHWLKLHILYWSYAKLHRFLLASFGKIALLWGLCPDLVYVVKIVRHLLSSLAKPDSHTGTAQSA